MYYVDAVQNGLQFEYYASKPFREYVECRCYSNLLCIIMSAFADDFVLITENVKMFLIYLSPHKIKLATFQLFTYSEK